MDFNRKKIIFQPEFLDDGSIDITLITEEEGLSADSSASQTGSEGGPAVPGLQSEFTPESAETGTEDFDEESSSFIRFDSGDIIKGIILSEILGKPKGRKRGRW